MSPLDERDFITLNAYLDNELTASERAAFEQRLAAEPALKQEMDSLVTTVNVLRLAERVRAPRNFTLDPAVYGRPVKRSLMERLGLIGMSQLVAVGGTLVAAMICAGAIIFASQGLFLGAPAPSAAEMPMADEAANQAAQEESITALDAAQEAGVAEAVEATEEPEAEATEAAEEVEITAYSTAAAEVAPFEPLESPEPDLDGGQGGGTGGQGGAGGAGGTGPVIGPMTPTSMPTTVVIVTEEEGDNQRNAGEDGSEPPAEGEVADNADVMFTVPTDEAGKSPEELPTTPTIPIVPIAIAVLVLALGSGVLIARLARRR